MISFSSPRGVFLGEHLEFAWWSLGIANDEWWRRGYSHIWEGVDFPYYIHRLDYEDEVTREMQVLRTTAAAENKPVSRYQAAEAILSRPAYRLIHMTVNLIAALHNFHGNVVSSETEPSASGSSSRHSPLKAVASINLDDTGLSTWARTWCAEGAQRDGVTPEEGRPGHGVPPSLHERKGHMMHLWVLRENVQPGEQILETRMFDETERCRVCRPRSGSVVGGGLLRSSELRIRRGPDDIIVSSGAVNVTDKTDT